MSVRYRSCNIIPGPFVNIDKEYTVAADGRRLGTLYTITLNGTLTANMGSPQGGSLVGAGWGGPRNKFWQNSGYPPDESTAVLSRLSQIENKQEALRDLFSVDGQWLEFQDTNGHAPLKCQPRLVAMHFDPDLWVNTCKFTITLNCDLLYVNGNPETDYTTHTELINSSTENWQIQEGEFKKSFQVSHTVSAVGKRTFDSLGNEANIPWQNARTFVQTRLGLGYTGITSLSPISVQTVISGSMLNAGAINVSGLPAHNFSRNETIDEFGGSYSLTESWLLMAASGANNYNVSVRKIVDDPYTTTQASIQGKIVGFYDTLFDYDTKIASAQYVWAALQPTGLYGIVSAYATGIAFNVQPTQAAIDYNPIDGTIDYNYSFDNKLYQGDVFETFTITKKTSPEDYKVFYDIAGSIKGRKYQTDIDPKAPYQRASAYFNGIFGSGLFYTRIIQSGFFPEATGLLLNQYPLAKTIDLSEAEGTVTYSFEFNNRINDFPNTSNYVEEEYTISSNFSREDGKTNYTIAGSVKGLNVGDSTTRDVRFVNATGYFYTYTVPALLSRISSYYNTTVPNPLPLTTEIQFAKNAGLVTYNYSYNNKPAPFIAGVLSESINVTDQNKSATISVIAKIPIIGRAAGPILQQMGTTQEKIRSLHIETVMAPVVAATLADAYNAQPDYTSYVTQLAPTNGNIQEDTVVWDWANGRYSRSVSWIYT